MAASIPFVNDPSETAIWDSKVVSDLMSLTYVRAVVFTNERGRVLHVISHREAPEDLGKIVEVMLGAITRAGDALELGAPRVSASIYDHGVLIVARHRDMRAAVLAEASSNLGNLLHHVRRAFAEGEQ